MAIEKYSFNGVEYLYEHDTRIMEISHDKITPDKIYKYYSLSKFSVEALTEGYLYASHPNELNDALDCSEFLIVAPEKIPIGSYEKFYGHHEFSREGIKELYRADTEFPPYCRSYINVGLSKLSNVMGVISTSCSGHSILMWPHYSQEIGFQIKIDTQKLIQSIENNLGENAKLISFAPINYVEELEPINFNKFKSIAVPFLYMTNIKSKHWSYEKEWRFLVEKPHMGVPFSKQGLNINNDVVGYAKGRNVSYDSSLVEEICVAHNFFTTKFFEINPVSASVFKVKPKNIPENWSYEHHVKLLDHICEHLSDRFYHSGTKYEETQDHRLVVRRTKEHMEITKDADGTYQISRTYDFKVLREEN